MSRIMIVDDDRHISDMLKENLVSEGYDVITAYSGTEALFCLEKETPDLVLLDLMLPGMEGEELLPRIKEIPVIVVSAKADISDKVGLLRSGAADYITKPFDLQELLARIEVQLRSAGDPQKKNLLCFHELSLDTDTRTLCIGGKPVKLTKTEFAILKLLMQNPEQVVAKLTILERISEDTPDCTEDSLKIHVHNLRRKIKTAADRDYISAVWGIGFMLTGKN